MSKIHCYLPDLTASISIVVASILIYYGTLAIGNRINDSMELPIPTKVAIAFSKYHVSSCAAVLGIFAIVFAEIKIEEKQNRLVLQNLIIAIFLVVTAITFMAMALPFTCFCDA